MKTPEEKAKPRVRGKPIPADPFFWSKVASGWSPKFAMEWYERHVLKLLVPPQLVRVIETRGCMGDDHKIRGGTAIRFVDRAPKGSAVNVAFVVLKMNDGTEEEWPLPDRHVAEDGVWEWRF